MHWIERKGIQNRIGHDTGNELRPSFEQLGYKILNQVDKQIIDKIQSVSPPPFASNWAAMILGATRLLVPTGQWQGQS